GEDEREQPCERSTPSSDSRKYLLHLLDEPRSARLSRLVPRGRLGEFRDGLRCEAHRFHLDGRRIRARASSHEMPKGPFTAKGTLSSDRGWTREFEVSHKWTDGVSATYMEVTAPSDLKDTRFLVFDRDTGRDEQHIYVPALKRSIQ